MLISTIQLGEVRCFMCGKIIDSSQTINYIYKEDDNKYYLKYHVKKWCSDICKHSYKSRTKCHLERCHGVGSKKINYGEILINQKYKCNICGDNLVGIKYHIDHIKPVSKGGWHTRSNIQLLCGHCNLKKGNKDVE